MNNKHSSQPPIQMRKALDIVFKIMNLNSCISNSYQKRAVLQLPYPLGQGERSRLSEATVSKGIQKVPKQQFKLCVSGTSVSSHTCTPFGMSEGASEYKGR